MALAWNRLDEPWRRAREVETRFEAARLCVEIGELADAETIVSDLASDLRTEAGSYAKIIEAGIALRRKSMRQGIKLLTEANELLDTWIGHFDLGRAYLEAGQFAQADSEFDRCIKRRCELLSRPPLQLPPPGLLLPVSCQRGVEQR